MAEESPNEEITEVQPEDGSLKRRGFCEKLWDIIKRDMQQIYALTMKNITLQSRQYLSNIFQILTPIIIMFFIFLLQLIVNYLIANLDRFKHRPGPPGRRALDEAMIREDSAQLNLDTIMMMAPMMNMTLPNLILYAANDTDPWYIEDIKMDSMGIYRFNFNESGGDIDIFLFDEIEKMMQNRSLETEVIGGLKFHRWDEDGIDATLQYYRDADEDIGFFSKSQTCSIIGGVFNKNMSLPCQFVYSTGLMNMVSNVYIQENTQSKMHVRTLVAQMPFTRPAEEEGFSLDIAEALGMFFFPVILLLIFPVILHSIVAEKETEIKQVMHLMGMKERNYLFATYCFEMVVYLVSGAVFVIMGAILQYRFFVQTDPLILFLIIVGSGFSCVSLAFFISAFLSKAFVATILGYLTAIFVPICGIILNSYVLTEGAYHFKWLLLIPVLPITDIMWHATTACQSYHCLSLSSFASNYDFDIALAFLFFDPIIFFLLGVYLDQIIPKPWGVRKSPLFPIKWLVKQFSSMLSFQKKKAKVSDANDGVDEKEDIDVRQLRLEILDDKITTEGSGIIVKGLVKHFGRGSKKNKAVDNVYFNVRKRECLGLLGPNGAGKTTTVNMICGLFGQTAGTAFVNGYDITNDMDKVHQSLGLCPQFSYVFLKVFVHFGRVVWPELTPEEHLLFYARMKGYPILKERSHVTQILKEVGLLDDMNTNYFKKVLNFLFPKKRAKHLSGGMKRRLSIAISLCGDPDVLVLDEPTTGLDPRNRRDIWDVIIRQKKERAVVLTTHSMEEADALSDRIAIMSYGKLVCFGSSLRLKNRFGNGYVIHIKHNAGRRSTAVGFIEETSRKLDLELAIIKEFGSNITFESRTKVAEASYPIADIFESIETKKKEMCIVDFEISQTTLEDVFLNVITKEEHKRMEDSETESTSVFKEKDNEKKKQVVHTKEESKQEEATLQKSQSGEEVVKIDEVDEIEFFEGMVNGNHEKVRVEASNVTFGETSIPYKEISEFSRVSSDENPEETTFRFEYGEQIVDIVFTSEEIANSFKEQISDHMNSVDELVQPEVPKPKFVIESQGPWESVVSLLRDSFSQIGFLLLKNFLLSIRQWKVTFLEIFSPFLVVMLLFFMTLIARIDTTTWYIHPPISAVRTTQLAPCKTWGDVTTCYEFVYATNGNSLAEVVMESITDEFEKAPFLAFDSEDEMLDWIVDNKNTTQMAISFSNVTSETIPFPPMEYNITTYTLFFNATEDLVNQVAEYKSLIDNRILFIEGEVEDKRRMSFHKQGYPKTRSFMAISGQSRIFMSTGPLFFSLVGMIVFVACLYHIVVEKEKNLRTGLELIGLKVFSYFSSWFITYMVISFITTAITMISGYVFAMEVFLYCNPLLMFLLLFVYSMSLICFAFAVTPLFNKGKTAIIFGFIVTGISFILNFFLANGSLIYLLFELKDGWQFIYWLFQLLYPPFNFAKMFSDIVNKTLRVYDFGENEFVKNDGYSWKQFGEKNRSGDFSNQASFYSILFLLLNSFVFFVIFWYLDNILPRPNYTPKKPWFFLLPSYWGLDIFCKKNVTTEVASEYQKKQDVQLKRLDNDLLMEYKNVRDENNNYSIRVLNSRKIYRLLLREDCHALKGIDFGAEHGSCLSLLGDNGAGKTTTIGILSGVVPITGGDMLVGGVSVKDGRDEIRQNLGVCLQHNILWDDLTAGDHIRLFSQIKNVKGIKREVQQRLTEVSLYRVRNDRSKTFSGGMKRRLCAALSYVGENSMVLLDEVGEILLSHFFSGLDPFSKREVWKIIKQKKLNNTTVLTTHSMEEADALSDKIVIMKLGEVMCIGDSLHLKNKYDAGYVLKLICLTGKEEETSAMVEKRLPSAKLVTENAGNFIFNVSTKDVQELISFLRDLEAEKAKEESILKDFGISHTTLEDVYLKVNDININSMSATEEDDV